MKMQRVRLLRSLTCCLKTLVPALNQLFTTHLDQLNLDEYNSKIKNLQSYIDFVKGMKTAYLKNGKLKKGYQLAVNDHEQKIKTLKNI